MNEAAKIKRLERTVSRLLESNDSLKDEVNALNEALKNKEKEMSDYIERNRYLEQQMEKMLLEHAEAVEAACEAKEAYESAAEKYRELVKKYNTEMKTQLKKLGYLPQRKV